MTKYQLHELADKLYWGMSQAQRDKVWIDIKNDVENSFPDRREWGRILELK